jgi:hypothetical protein
VQGETLTLTLAAALAVVVLGVDLAVAVLVEEVFQEVVAVLVAAVPRGDGKHECQTST